MKKILVVDDEEDILSAISMFLEGEGYIVQTTTNGEEIREKIAQFEPNVILLDILLAGSDGRDICRCLKHDGKTKSIPVIMVAAHPHIGQESKMCGADDFLPKPFDIDDLLHKVTKHLQTN